MVELTIALRFVHFAAAIALAGELAFLLLIVRPALRETGQTASAWRELRDRLMRVASRCLALVLASGVLWFFVQAATMSGAALASVLDGEIPGAVLTGTLFGRVWILRLALAAALGGALLFLRHASGRREAAILGACAALAGGLLATLAWAGHAAAEQDTDRIVHLAADVVHLLAASVWLGALLPLASVLGRARRAASAAELELAVRTTRRFSTLGVASVGALALTGAVNAWYTVGSVPAFFGTGYGWLLSAKLALFAAMVTLAASNRLRWTPRLSQAPQESAPSALRRLRRNAIAETALGLVVLGIVGALGATVPAPHVQPVWPFSHTLDWNAVAGLRRVIATLVSTLAVGAIIAAGVRVRWQEMTAAALAVTLGAFLIAIWLLAVPAHPTTYFQSPVSYSAASVTRGAPLYAEHCEGCHGPFGNGDGPAADSLRARPPNLPTRLALRLEGDLLWSLEHGVPGTPMPGIGDRVGEERLWDLLNFLRALANADAGRRINALIEPWRPVTAPDFTFQIGRGTQDSLAQQRGRAIVLLVLYSRPQSLARLRALADSRPRLDRLGVRVVAVPMSEADAIQQKTPGVDAAMLAGPDAPLAAAYTMFMRTIVGPPEAPPYHAEFLIDRQGYLRARSIPGGERRGEPRGEPIWTMPELQRQAMLLNKEKPRAPAPERHAH